MKYTIKTGDFANISTDCLVVGIYAGSKFTPGAMAADRASGGLMKQLAKQGDLSGAAGQTLLVPCQDKLRAARLLIVGLGDEKELDTEEYASAIRSTARSLQNTGAATAAITLAEAKVKGRSFEDRTRMIVEGFSASYYRFDQLKNKKSKKQILSRIVLPVQNTSSVSSVRKSALEGQAVSNGVQLACDLANLPGNICTPSYLANQARKL